MDTFFGHMSTAGDGVMLLRAIKEFTYNFQIQKYLTHSLYKSKRSFTCFSKEGQLVQLNSSRT